MDSTSPSGADHRVAIVTATRNRVSSLLPTLERLSSLPERPHVVVVDNASEDGTTQAVRRRHPDVQVIPLARNLGAAARTVGARRVQAPYVAFNDDDSWWAPGALLKAADLLDRHPRLGLLNGRILVGAGQTLEPACEEMAHTPLPRAADLPGPSILGFVACGSVVRRAAFLAGGGFEERMSVGGEEELLAIDLAAAGWGLAYVDEVVAHHHPSPSRDPEWRKRCVIRNALWTAWLRRHPGAVLRRTIGVCGAALADATARAALMEAIHELPWVLRERRRVPDDLEAAIQTLDG